jgi:hypothetical protein
MRRGLLAAGSCVVVFGAFLLVAPIANGDLTSATVRVGQSVDVAVPWSASVSGASVTVMLDLEGDGCSSREMPFQGPVCPWTGPLPYLVVFDCGASSCKSDRNYSVVGITPATPPITQADFSAVPGHTYELLAAPLTNGTDNGSIAFAYEFETPVLGGTAGIAGLVGGAVAVVQGVRLPRRPLGAPVPNPSSR